MNKSNCFVMSKLKLDGQSQDATKEFIYDLFKVIAVQDVVAHQGWC